MTLFQLCPVCDTFLIWQLANKRSIIFLDHPGHWSHDSKTASGILFVDLSTDETIIYVTTFKGNFCNP
jgi:hypothetical protein